jgi:hypothetical protein
MLGKVNPPVKTQLLDEVIALSRLRGSIQLVQYLAQLHH